MLSVTIPNINPSQNTPVLPNIRRIVMRPSGESCSLKNSAKPSLATILYPFGLARGWSVNASMATSSTSDRDLYFHMRLDPMNTSIAIEASTRV